MHYPATRIRFARQVAAEMATLERAGLLAAEAAMLIREHGISPEFARRHALAYSVSLASKRKPTRHV
jgi:hypothetical protein